MTTGMTESSVPNKARDRWKTALWVLLCAIGPVLITYAVCWFTENYSKVQKVATWPEINWRPPTFLDFDSTAAWVLRLWIVEGVYWAFRTIWTQTRTRTEMFKIEFDEIKANFEARWTDLVTSIDSRDIVFNIDMSTPYSKQHLDDLTRRLGAAFPIHQPGGEETCPYQSDCKGSGDGRRMVDKVTQASLYAIDATNPRDWWSESMLGYLAIQANWKSQDSPPFHVRRLSRLFVWTRADLLSPLGAKLIVLHRLFGFDTYVVVSDNYARERNSMWKDSRFDKIRTAITNIDKHFGLKEIVVWDGCAPAVSTENRGFRSFWRVTVLDAKKRMEDPDSDALQAPTDNQKIRWRSFSSTDEADCYVDFFMMLTNSPCEVARHADFADRSAEWNGRKHIFKVTATDSEEIRQILTEIANPHSVSRGTHGGATSLKAKKTYGT